MRMGRRSEKRQDDVTSAFSRRGFGLQISKYVLEQDHARGGEFLLVDVQRIYDWVIGGSSMLFQGTMNGATVNCHFST